MQDNNKNAIVSHYQDLLDKGMSLDSASLLKQAYELIMLAERNNHNANTGDKSNGYYPRQLGTPYGKIDLAVPRSRISGEEQFRPQILPDLYQRNQQESELLLQALLQHNYSPNQISTTLRSLGLSYSEKELAQISEDILRKFNAWNNRDLSDDFIAIFIDAYNAEMMIENKVQNNVTFIVQAINFEGQKDIIGVFNLVGRESKEYWLQVFNKLIHRGLKRPLYVVTDDFAGIVNAVQTIFPESFHQLCTVHLKRNLRKNLPITEAQIMIETLQTIQNSSLTFDQAKTQLQSQIDQLNQYPAYAKYLNSRIDQYLNFTRLEKPIRKYFNSTNTVESFNSILEKMRRKSGNFFQNENVLNINIFINYQKLRKKWIKGLPLVKGHIYAVRQLFATQFDHLPNSYTQDLG